MGVGSGLGSAVSASGDTRTDLVLVMANDLPATTKVFPDNPTMFLGKYAYGAPVVEAVFGKQELLMLCRDAGLRLEREWPCIPYDVYGVTGRHSTTETYLFAL